MHRRGVGAGAIAKKKLAEVNREDARVCDCVYLFKCFLSHLSHLFKLVSLLQAKYKERGTVLAEDQIVQVSL